MDEKLTVLHAFLSFLEDADCSPMEALKYLEHSVDQKDFAMLQKLHEWLEPDCPPDQGYNADDPLRPMQRLRLLRKEWR